MTTRWSRRGFLAASSGTALALGVHTTADATPLTSTEITETSEAADEFAALRAKWRTLILGEGFSPTAEPFRTRLAELGSTAGQLQSTMAPASGSLWPDWGASLPDVNWVGGATDGQRAAIGQYLKGLQSTLLAKKSWFCLDDSIVCLGAGITCTDGTAVESTVENRNLGPTGSTTFTVDGTAKPTTHPWSETLTGTTWAHMGGHGGYVFPGGATVKALREARDGKWSDINKSGATTVLNRKYLTMYVDHGTDPANASYAYLLMPGATAPQTQTRAAATSWLTILANTDNQQGVSVASLGFTGVNFWFGGTVGDLTASNPCCVMISEKSDGTAVICVSDPMRRQTGLTLTWNKVVSSVTSKPSTVTSASTGSALTLTFGDLSTIAGVTQKIHRQARLSRTRQRLHVRALQGERALLPQRRSGDHDDRGLSSRVSGRPLRRPETRCADGRERPTVECPVPVGFTPQRREYLSGDVDMAQPRGRHADAGARGDQPGCALLRGAAAVAARVDMAVVGDDEERPLFVVVRGPGAYGGRQAAHAGVGALHRDLVRVAAAEEVRAIPSVGRSRTAVTRCAGPG